MTPRLFSSLAPSLRGCVLVLWALFLGACSPHPLLDVDPGKIVLSPEHPRVDLRLQNPSSRRVPVGPLRITGENWDAFSIENEENPRSIPAGDDAVLHLAVSRRAFRNNDRDGHLQSYRGGQATLELGPQLDPVALVFQPRSSTELRWIEILLRTLGLAALWFVIARLTKRQQKAPAFAALVALAIVPWAPPLCDTRLLAMVGPAELNACAASQGGNSLRLLPLPLGLAAWWIAASIGQFANQKSLDDLRRCLGPGLGLALCLVLTALVFKSTDLDHWTTASLDNTQEGRLLPAGLGFLICASLWHRRGDRSRLQLLVLATMAATAFAGGAKVPALEEVLGFRRLHLTDLLLGFGGLAVKTWVAAWLINVASATDQIETLWRRHWLIGLSILFLLALTALL